MTLVNFDFSFFEIILQHELTRTMGSGEYGRQLMCILNYRHRYKSNENSKAKMCVCSCVTVCTKTTTADSPILSFFICKILLWLKKDCGKILAFVEKGRKGRMSDKTDLEREMLTM